MTDKERAQAILARLPARVSQHPMVVALSRGGEWLEVAIQAMIAVLSGDVSMDDPRLIREVVVRLPSDMQHLAVPLMRLAG